MKIKLSQILPYVLIVVAFLLGKLLTPDNSKAYQNAAAQARKELQRRSAADSIIIGHLNATIDSIGIRHRRDSLALVRRLASKDLNIDHTKRKINETNFENATIERLDSIRHALYADRLLPHPGLTP